MAVVVALSVLLHLEQALAHLGEERIPVLQKCIDSICAGSPCNVRKQSQRGPTENHLKW